MDGISPDVPAWFAYLIVFVGGLITAITNIRRLVGDHSGYWRMRETWLLLMLYLAFPVTLYWLLDRAGAIHDTSLFAAILVGFAYQQVMSGSFDSVKVPGAAKQYWRPFQAVASSLAERIATQWREHGDRVYEQIRTRLGSDHRLNAVTRLAFEKADDPDRLAKDLEEIEKVRTVAEPHVADGEDHDQVIHQRRLRRVLKELRSAEPENWGYLLRERGILSGWDYFCWFKHGREKALAGLGIGAILLSAGLGVHRFQQHDYQDVYHSWRLTKPDVTESERYRTWRYFANHDPIYEHPLIVGPIQRLESNLLGTAAIDQVFRVLAFSQQPRMHPDVVGALVGALRTPSAGTRLRIHQELLRGHQAAAEPDPALVAWVPSEDDTPARINEMITRWEDWLDQAESGADES